MASAAPCSKHEHMSGPILDVPDAEMQEIMKLQWLGRPLSKQQQARWANRLNVEKETMRQGGQMKGSIVPPAQDPRAVGREEAQELQGSDLSKSADLVLEEAQV